MRIKILDRFLNWHDKLNEPWRFIGAILIIHPCMTFWIPHMLWYSIIGLVVVMLLALYRDAWINRSNKENT